MRNPPFVDHKAANYAGACHRTARCADPLGLQPVHGANRRFQALAKIFVEFVRDAFPFLGVRRRNPIQSVELG
jgi:hypothetical protein